MQAARNEQIFPRDPNKTYSLMAIVEGESFHVEKGPEDTVQSWPHLMIRELLLFLVVVVGTVGISLLFDASLEGPARSLQALDQSGKGPMVFRRHPGTSELFGLLGGIGVLSPYRTGAAVSTVSG